MLSVKGLGGVVGRTVTEEVYEHSLVLHVDAITFCERADFEELLLAGLGTRMR
jgi:hypothetical protein